MLYGLLANSSWVIVVWGVTEPVQIPSIGRIFGQSIEPVQIRNWLKPEIKLVKFQNSIRLIRFSRPLQCRRASSHRTAGIEVPSSCYCSIHLPAFVEERWQRMTALDLLLVSFWHRPETPVRHDAIRQQRHRHQSPQIDIEHIKTQKILVRRITWVQCR